MVPGLQQLSGIIDFAFSRDILHAGCRALVPRPHPIFNELPVTLGGVHIDINISQCSGIVSSSSWYRLIPLTKRFQTVITTIEAKVVAKTG